MLAASSGPSIVDEKKTSGGTHELLADLTQAYETLRDRALRGSARTAPGLAILQQQGVVAWMEICSAVLPSSASPKQANSGSLPADMVMVMAQMIWARFEEIHS
jgi:hypothetical protein